MRENHSLQQQLDLTIFVLAKVSPDKDAALYLYLAEHAKNQYIKTAPSIECFHYKDLEKNGAWSKGFRIGMKLGMEIGALKQLRQPKRN